MVICLKTNMLERLKSTIIVISILALVQDVFALDLSILLESGAVWQERNDVRIPPEGGSYVEFDKWDGGPFLHKRIELNFAFANKHSFRALYAPFQLSVEGRVDKSINYNDVTFLANQDITVNYKFNSYRWGYVYHFLGLARKRLDLGFTLKVREAEIEFVQGSTKTKYDNVGLVPLFYFAYVQPLSSNWQLDINSDLAGASQGRAIDFTTKLRRQLNKNFLFGFGVRTLEGGANNEKVFTFSWFNYAVADLLIQF